ncbi:hypothetical protein MXD61_16255 [Frankia sp. AgPm24]|uniref:hypothetical protein n=2 Tax=Frankia TaxID=1854 RepID=UPI00200FFB85|nr:hypothetical protein [Frankia sp. AgPm24]MCK9923402.1 hypothetical protein [Frankia sp. AgPm24]
MFGFELQTQNVFVSRSGVADIGEREVVYRHPVGLTLEGDETHLLGATSELEFVTKPFADERSARAALTVAARIAAKLAEGGQRDITFDQNTEFEGGTWLRSGTLRITDPTFGAQAQATVGIPLATLPTFFHTVLNRTRHASDIDDLGTWSKLLEWPSGPSPKARGFLWACQMFLFSATAVPLSRFVDPVKPTMPDVTNKIFDFTDTAFTQDVHAVALKLPAEKVPEKTLVLVNADSPKSAFLALHRTDFHSMYQALPRFDRDLLAALDITAAIWPQDYGGPDHRYVFPLPYRADPQATDVSARTGTPLTNRTEWLPRGIIADHPATWSLVAHGPSIRQWWTSVLHGDEARRNIAKDAASPPPGHRGRDPRYLADFPDPKVENKADYYGMGAFPTDTGSAADDRLAVYEIRAFMEDLEMPPKAELTSGRWATIADIFFTHYAPR